MANLGVKFEATTEETENQGGSYEPLPHMYAELWATAMDLDDTKDKRGTQAAINFEVTAPEEWKGKSFKEWWTIDHADGSANNSYWKFGKPQLSRFGRAVGVKIGPDTDTDDLTFKTFVAEVNYQPERPDGKGGTYKAKNQIGRFFYTDDAAKEPVPELGVIEDKPKPANDNRAPAANDNSKPAAAAKKTPW
ncbi:hypothetical protein [Aquamicrobium soli]|uniref:DUF669 domain-containing protein n=1 Tax=Aquamicrobium soli TaxID=1811518 RepID=A0ABV7KEC7_9HYPH